MGRRSLGLGVVLLSFAALAAEPAWEVYDEQGGVTYERRAVSGSPFQEYRATLSLPGSPAEVFDALWKAVTEAAPAKTVKRRRVLERTPTAFVVYDQISAPVVSDRDVTLRMTRAARADGTFELRFEATTAVGPPPSGAYVRIPRVEGAWTVGPGGRDGGARLTYTCYSEPGGAIPAFLVRGSQANQAKLDVERALSGLRAR